MIAAAPVITQLYLSVLALLGLMVLHGVLSARDAFAPLNRRFLFGLRVTMLLFAGRVLLALTGIEAFRILILLGAALIPLAVLVLTEGLLRRHAPLGFKTVVAAGALVFGATSLWYGSAIDPARLWSLLAFQVLGFAMSGYLVITRDRASLGAQENRMVVRLGLSLLVLIPLAVGDFLMVEIGLPVQLSALAVLLLCWLAVGLGRPHQGHRRTLSGLAVIVFAAACAGALISLLAAFDLVGWVLVLATITATMLFVTLVTDARGLRHEQDSLGLLQHLAGADMADPLDFLEALRTHPQVDGALVIQPADLSGLETAVLARIFETDPVLSKANPPVLGVAADDHIAFLFGRFAATHIMDVGADGPLLVALSLPGLGATPMAEVELRVVQRMAKLISRAKETGDAKQS